MKLAIAKSLFLLFGGIAMICVGAWFTISHIEFIRNSEQTSGVVVEIISKRSTKGTNLYHPIVRYRPTGYDSPIQFTAKPGLWSWLYKIGENVIVIYYLDRPYEAKIKSFWMLWFLPLILFLFGSMCSIAGWHTLSRKR